MENFVLMILLVSIGIILILSILKIFFYLIFNQEEKEYDIDYDRPPPRDSNLH